MSTLNINELKNLAVNNNLLGNDYLNDNFQSASYDLRIGAIFRDNEIYSKDFQKENFNNNIDIKPSEIVSILTLEKVTIPNDCIGTVFAINKHSSTGLLILNPGHIDPGYSGSLSICSINLSKEIRTISIGEPIFTLILQKLNVALNDKELYKNKTFNSRKEEEQIFLKTKSKRLSNSFFDLISSYDGTRKLLVEKLWERIWRNVKACIKILTVLAAVAGILKLGYDLLPDTMPVFRKKGNSNIIDTSSNNIKDSIINSNNIEISNLKDSINKLYLIKKPK